MDTNLDSNVELKTNMFKLNFKIQYITEKRTTHTATSEKLAFHNQRLIEIQINRPI